MKKNYDISNYDCKKAFTQVNDSVAYLEELDKAIKCFETANTIEENKDYENSFIIYYRGIQLLGNSLLIKKRNIKSKEKNCQFLYLYEEKIINEEILSIISEFSIKRNNIYYHNYSVENEINEEDFKFLKEKIYSIKNTLYKKLEE